jgi:hypothetical protein
LSRKNRNFDILILGHTTQNLPAGYSKAMEVGDIVKIRNLNTVVYNGLRGKIIRGLSENGRYGVRVLLDESKTKDMLLLPQNLGKVPDEDHYGFWGCSGCGAQCNCDRESIGFHSNECHHYMNTLRRKGPLCNGSSKGFWVRCCNGEFIDGPCKALNRGVCLVPRYKYPEQEWVTQPDGTKKLEPKAWPYL